MRKKIKRSCALILSIMMAASYTGCSTQKETEAIPTLLEPQNEEVSTVKAERADIRVYKTEMTRVEPMAEEVFFSMDGRPQSSGENRSCYSCSGPSGSACISALRWCTPSFTGAPRRP